MKKIWLLLLVIGLAVVIETGIFLSQSHKSSVIGEGESGLFVKVKCGEDEQIIWPWLDEKSGTYYFFLPAFVKNRIFTEKGEAKLSVNNKRLGMWSRFCWDEDEIYHISGLKRDYEVRFMKSENIPTVFVETESRSLDNLYADKANKENGKILVAQSSGNVEYRGVISQISKRGQVTSSVNKIPFSLELEKKAPLCGMRSEKNGSYYRCIMNSI